LWVRSRHFCMTKSFQGNTSTPSSLEPNKSFVEELTRTTILAEGSIGLTTFELLTERKSYSDNSEKAASPHSLYSANIREVHTWNTRIQWPSCLTGTKKFPFRTDCELVSFSVIKSDIAIYTPVLASPIEGYEERWKGTVSWSNLSLHQQAKRDNFSSRFAKWSPEDHLLLFLDLWTDFLISKLINTWKVITLAC